MATIRLNQCIYAQWFSFVAFCQRFGQHKCQMTWWAYGPVLFRTPSLSPRTQRTQSPKQNQIPPQYLNKSPHLFPVLVESENASVCVWWNGVLSVFSVCGSDDVLDGMLMMQGMSPERCDSPHQSLFPRVARGWDCLFPVAGNCGGAGPLVPELKRKVPAFPRVLRLHGWCSTEVRLCLQVQFCSGKGFLLCTSGAHLHGSVSPLVGTCGVANWFGRDSIGGGNKAG